MDGRMKRASKATAKQLYTSWLIRRNVRLRMAHLGVSMPELAKVAGVSRQTLDQRLKSDSVTTGTILLFSVLLVVRVSDLMSHSFRTLERPLPGEGWKDAVNHELNRGIGTKEDRHRSMVMSVISSVGVAPCPVCNGEKVCGSDQALCPLCYYGGVA
jgi:transcriptional regulator with XRE-family HTH domain